ncbi:MAG: 5,10-methylenetetrahydrofolate reductase [Gammaproteobacteria bacterium]|nr:MAG: 5,10-methylenetetrahydrofolate reductase [Gammaproteobacteria bacterium]
MNTAATTRFSYEFFPPRNDNMVRKLWRSVGQLERLDPLFFSMTYGALGSAQKVSIDSAIEMHQESPVAVAAHLTCANASAFEIEQIAKQYYDSGIRRFVALRGDAADSTDGESVYGYNSAVELVEALRKLGEVDISVAAYPEVHPQAQNAQSDLAHLKRKLDAGANRAITQYFFDADCFLRFRDQARRIGIEKPIIPGILPVHDYQKVKAFSQRCGATVPTRFEVKFASVANNPAAQYRLSLDLAVELCERLVREGVDHFHLYTLNQTDMCLDISLALGASVVTPQLFSAA